MPMGARINLDQDLEPGLTGRVRFRGTMWDAVSEDRLPAGSEAEIIGMDKSKGILPQAQACPAYLKEVSGVRLHALFLAGGHGYGRLRPTPIIQVRKEDF